ncbi:MAG: selenocysteine-specific translation elongation factor [Gemmatimonadota bacterium]
MILGTAGHVDHGKTALVRALTGVDTDRLPEEKRRGITIDLGFAPLELAGVGTVGVIDVPGHEAFVRTMVAGATGIDLALLTIAADAGVMPQTREHLAILSILGVRNGVAAITKCDLADEDWLQLVEEDLRATLAMSTLADVPIVRVSAHTGMGLDELRAALARAAAGVPARAADDLFRLPVDRAFTVRGTGTVVTGTVWSGSIPRDGTARLYPGDKMVRVRGLQIHGSAVERVTAGDRAAVALAGVELSEVARGAVLVQGDGWKPSRVLRADVAMLEGHGAAFGPRSKVRLHIGTNDVGARMVARADALEAGDSAPVRIVVDDPVVVRAGDRFVLRSASPVVTLGGGTVVDPAAPSRARPWPEGDRSPLTMLGLMADEAGSTGILLADLPVRLGIHPADIDSLLLGASGWRAGQRYLSGGARQRIDDALLASIGAYHREHPLEPGAPLQWLRSKSGAGDAVADALLAALTAEGRLVCTNGLACLPGFVSTLSANQAELAGAVLTALERAGSEPPTVEELALLVSETERDVLDVLRWLARERRVVVVESARYYASDVVRGLLDKLRDGMTDDREYAPSELRELLGFTRKFMIPFLEYCDIEGYTKRTGQGRRFIRHSK